MGNNLTPVIEIVTWFLLVTLVLSVIARGATKAVIVRSLGLDDYLISVATLFAIGQSVAVSVQTAHGYGKPAETLTSSQLDGDLKAEYVATLFYIPSLCFAKVAVLSLIQTITPHRNDRRWAIGLAILIFVWALTSELVTTFSCKIPTPWDYTHGKCLDRYSWWSYFEITNIITDVALILLPLAIIWKIQTSWARKAGIFSFFALRTTVTIASMTKLVFLTRTRDSQDPTIDSWPVTICTQTIECLSILSTCVLYLKPFLDSLESGFIRSDDMRRRGLRDDYDSNPGGSSGSKYGLSSRKQSQTERINFELKGLTRGRNETHIAAANTANKEDAESQHSRAHMIKETRTVTVEDSTDRGEIQFVSPDIF
ncbi:MAG: hypothetical protein ASARMPREDX12_005417 [Alectoria sarmentosa]|nr:MAG: hypothetical protein ASARMPREDX12_005417 [Alectoria sarmentosa]